MSSENVETVREFITSLWIPEKKQSALALLSSELLAREAASLPYGGEYKGVVGFEKLLENVAAVADLEILRKTFRDADDVVIGDMDVRLTARTNGRSLETRVVELYEVADGMISRAATYSIRTPRPSSICVFLSAVLIDDDGC